MRNKLARLNVPDGKGADFADLEAHFILCSDEACLMAGANGAVKVLGDVEKAKHEKILNNSRDSITILRCASTAGSTGPTNFVMQGNKAIQREVPPPARRGARFDHRDVAERFHDPRGLIGHG